MKTKLILRRIFLQVPFLYRFYQSNSLVGLRSVFQPFYEKEFRELRQLVGTEWNPSSIIDVGGNLGQSGLAMSRIFKSENLFIFEPNPPMARQCRRLQFESIKNVQVFEVGLSKMESFVELFTPSYNRVTFFGLASLSEEQSISLLRPESIWGYDENKLRVDRTKIELRTLDSFGFNTQFIKIDVEGAEVDVIDGALETIKKCKPIILVECTGSLADVRERLIPIGYINLELEEKMWEQSQGRRLNQIFIPHNF
jgi:FkbM family methyltransferase